MKGKITSEYIRRVKKLCRSRLDGGNLIDGINAWAVGVVHYSAGIVDWTMEKIEKYQELAFEIRRIHGASKVTTIPGALGSISKGAKTWFGKLDVPDFLGSVQLSSILGTAHLLRKVLCL